jgi:hypothetical protein
MRRALTFLGLGIVAACGSSASPAPGIFSSSGGESSGGSSSGGSESSSSSGGNSSGSSGGNGSSSGFSGSSGTSSSSGSGNSSSGTSSSSSGSSGGTSGSSSGSVGTGGGTPTMLPTVSGTCPTITTNTALTFNGEPVSIWAPSSTPATPGPLVMFWYETGGSANDVTWQFGTTEIGEVTAAGGVVASFAHSTATGTNTGDNVWYTGDFTTADQVVACAIQQHKIDPKRIYAMGASAGALQTTWMSYARSGYLAAVATISGGLTGTGGFYLTPTTLQDPSNIPAALVNHGAPGMDVVGIDFAVASAAWEANIKTQSGFSVDCNTGGGHVSGTPQIDPAIWTFFQDHPFKVKDDYTSGLPSDFPSDCQIGPRAADGGAP